MEDALRALQQQVSTLQTKLRFGNRGRDARWWITGGVGQLTSPRVWQGHVLSQKPRRGPTAEPEVYSVCFLLSPNRQREQLAFCGCDERNQITWLARQDKHTCHPEASQEENKITNFNTCHSEVSRTPRNAAGVVFGNLRLVVLCWARLLRDSSWTLQVSPALSLPGISRNFPGARPRFFPGRVTVW